MLTRIALTVIKGVLGGAAVGLLIGAYAMGLTAGQVLRRDEFSAAILFEEAELRYAKAVILSFVVTFAAIGPYVAAANFGPWIRHAAYGLAASVGLVVGIALLAAAMTNQQPFNRYIGSKSTCIDIARDNGLPLALLLGPPAGILIGIRKRRYHAEQPANPT